MLQQFIDDYTRPDIEFKVGMIGSRNFKIGTRCVGFIENNLFDAAHEAAYLVQYSDDELQDRYVLNNGNMTFIVPRFEVLGQMVCEPYTSKMSHREFETFIIQYYMMNEYKPMSLIEWFEEHTILNSMGWIPDWDVCRNFKKVDNDFLLHETKQYVDKWNIDSIKKRWFNLKLKRNV